ncbi:MepB family protein [Flavobacteriaceae bacterium F08102]|nr:MepB family protein [Flavobacteriaceae bacterium F08102]
MNDPIDTDLSVLFSTLYRPAGLLVSNFTLEPESQAYKASRYRINSATVISRKAKITPKKTGQFVTCWKRIPNGTIQPFDHTDPIDFLSITIRFKDRLGHFVFPTDILLENAILSTPLKEGKRGFRVYPPWDQPQNKQAIKSQQWQLPYFFELGPSASKAKVQAVFSLF